MIKKSNDSSPQNSILELKDFQNSFTKKQKEAILSWISNIGNQGGAPDASEVGFFIKCSKMLGLNLDDANLVQFQSEQGTENLITTLKSLNGSELEWFIVMNQSMIYCNKKTNSKEKSSIVFYFCDKIGIGVDKYLEVVNKGNELSKMFSFS